MPAIEPAYGREPGIVIASTLACSRAWPAPKNFAPALKPSLP